MNFRPVLFVKSLKISSTPLLSFVLERTKYSLPSGTLTPHDASTLNP